MELSKYLIETSFYNFFKNRDSVNLNYYDIKNYAIKQFNAYQSIDYHLNYILYSLIPTGYVLTEKSINEYQKKYKINSIPDYVQNNIGVEFHSFKNFCQIFKGDYIDYLDFAYEIDSNIIKREILVNEIITQFATLLQCNDERKCWYRFQEVNINDTILKSLDYLGKHSNLKEYLSGKNGRIESNDSICNCVYEDNYNEIVEKLKTGKYRYFTPFVGDFALWCFYTQTDTMGRIKIESELVNYECYKKIDTM